MLLNLVKIFAMTVSTFMLFSCSSLIDRLVNAVRKKPPFNINSRAHKLHEALLVIDMHADTLLWNRDLFKRAKHGHVDVPRMREGNLGLQMFSVVTQLPLYLSLNNNSAKPDSIAILARLQKWPLPTRTSWMERALYQAQKLQGYVERSDGEFILIKTQKDLKILLTMRDQGKPVVGAMLALEGTQALEGRLPNLDRLSDVGFRVIGLSHFIDNAMAGSAHGKKKYGLTDLGREMILSAQTKGMIIDLAHASPKAIEDTLAIVGKPVIVSHTGVRGTCDTVRNLTDQQIRAIAKNGGILGIGLFKYATCGKKIEDTVRAMRYVADLVGVEHVALGSDFDGAATVFDATGLPLLTQALMEDGFDKKEIMAIMGGNVLGILKQALPDKE
jgi:microsomal dipeptidase-like Zn-dependent dipeptidase